MPKPISDAPPDNQSLNLPWDEAFQEELAVVQNRRAEASPENLVGLAFSGGGIRSATFGLGVLEGLKNNDLLKKIDYLSTVSGGGYIGAWLSANCKRAACRKDKHEWLDREADWKESVTHLRRYSNYLSPKVGFFSADTWSMATIWIRNTLLVQLTVILAIAVALLPPRSLFKLFEYWPHAHNWRWTTIILFIFGVVGIAGNLWRQGRKEKIHFLQADWWLKGFGLAALCLAVARVIGILFHFQPFGKGPIDYRAAAPIAFLLVLAGFCLLPVAVKLLNLPGQWLGKQAPEKIDYTQFWVQIAVVIPMMATGFLVAAILWGQSQPGSGDLAGMETFGGFFQAGWRHWPFPLSVVFFSLFWLSICSIRDRSVWKNWLVAALAPVPAILVLHALLCAIMLLLHGWVNKGVGSVEGKWLAYIWTPALVLYAFTLTIVMLIGILGRDSFEGVREWWSRFGAWLGIYGIAWMLISLVAAYGPLASAILLDAGTWKAIGGGWVGTTIAGLLAANSGSTGGKPGKGSIAKIMDVVALIAPFVFIAGLLLAVSTILHLVITVNSGLTWKCLDQLKWDHWYLMYHAKLDITFWIFAACLLSVLLLAARVDINEFGLNAFYRSRLVRCYLGATRFHKGERHPQNFTGFDDEDDLKLAALADPVQTPAGPLHIVNCALNLGGSTDLALHTRHSAVFTLTPLHCGSRYLSRDQPGSKQPRSRLADEKEAGEKLPDDMELGYRPTRTFGGKDGQPTLGQAISVSGAAASPNMGYHTSPVVAFLLTLFNVRLGWWFPNPGSSSVNNPSPWFSLRYLLMELFGGADDKSSYLAISDGGHFENLAAYELVKRQCRVIVISDGECDPNLHFEGLGTLIRMCYVDFGAKISIDVGAIRREGGASWSNKRWAVGRIQYADGSRGTLIYFKASMTGSEDTPILQYQASHQTFPHESTSNQFYKEDQFESYRSLGREIVTDALDLVADRSDFFTVAQKLARLRNAD